MQYVGAIPFFDSSLCWKTSPGQLTGENQGTNIRRFVLYFLFFDGNFMERIGLKAPYNSASFWSYSSSICLWERPSLLISMISGFLNVSLSPKAIHFYLWRPHDSSRNLRTIQDHFDRYYVWKFQILRNPTVWNCWKNEHRQIPSFHLVNPWRSHTWDQ